MDFGDVMIASPNGRLARKPVSEGISPAPPPSSSPAPRWTI